MHAFPKLCKLLKSFSFLSITSGYKLEIYRDMVSANFIRSRIHPFSK